MSDPVYTMFEVRYHAPFNGEQYRTVHYIEHERSERPSVVAEKCHEWAVELSRKRYGERPGGDLWRQPGFISAVMSVSVESPVWQELQALMETLNDGR